MYNKNFIFSVFFAILTQINYAQKTKTDANIVGHVASNGKHIPFANIAIKGSTIGTATDETGHYQLINLPAGQHTLTVSVVGYKPEERTVELELNTTIEIKFELEPDILNLDEIVVSANRSEQKRTEAPVIVNTISTELFSTSQSVTLGEGLNFSPGLRLENNCQNCGFSQVRMNGMEGPYSQILIDSRPIFSGLAGVYGLELIPANMIERVEIVRGGGSVLYGSNAIAGTINVILKDPVLNTYEAGAKYALIGTGVDGTGDEAPDYSVHMNISLVSDDHKTGVAITGFNRNRKMFDANNDEFSELSSLENITLSTRFFHRFDHRDKLEIIFFTIKEQREGGNMQEYTLHERDIAEAVTQHLTIGCLSYKRFFRTYDLLTFYASGQFLNRDSYYGAEQSLSDYGNSRDNTYNIGAHYKVNFSNSSLLTGVENTGDFLVDKKLGYPDIDNADIVNDSITDIPHTGNVKIADQSSVTTGIFSQYEHTFNKMKIVLGVRYDHYEIKDLASEEGKAVTGDVFSPRVSFMYEIGKVLQARVGYSQGYRAPQVFDEDLHIETSGLRQVIHESAPGLKQETSHSFTASLDFNGLIGNVYVGFLAEGFYTRLVDPFVNEIGEPDEEGRVIYTRTNAEDGATVQGMNLEFKLKPVKNFKLTSGFTLQSSKYDEPQEFDEKRFFRTPNQYGYIAMDWNFVKNLCLSVTGNYTGSMLIPYFGTSSVSDTGELHESEDFYDMGLKLKYNIRLNGAILQLYGGIRNIFNSYQSDFDEGIDRDPAYIYGPILPRTVSFGIKISNLAD